MSEVLLAIVLVTSVVQLLVLLFLLQRVRQAEARARQWVDRAEESMKAVRAATEAVQRLLASLPKLWPAEETSAKPLVDKIKDLLK